MMYFAIVVVALLIVGLVAFFVVRGMGTSLPGLLSDADRAAKRSATAEARAERGTP